MCMQVTSQLTELTQTDNDCVINRIGLVLNRNHMSPLDAKYTMPVYAILTHIWLCIASVTIPIQTSGISLLLDYMQQVNDVCLLACAGMAHLSKGFASDQIITEESQISQP